MYDELKKRYFNWMYGKVIECHRASYRKLLHQLHETPFTYILPMDGNREQDGIDLRYRFGHAVGVSDLEIVNALDVHACSVLEMMVALAIHCEEDVMDDPDAGNRTSKWFMEMIGNLGLLGMDDTHYNKEYVDRRIDIFLKRRYSPDGTGGLFHLKKCHEDLRNVQIWYQMNWYLNEIMGY